MPYRLLWEDKGVVLVYLGEISDDDIIQSNLDIYEDKRFEHVRYQIVNLLESDSISFTDNAMHMVASLDAKAATWNPKVRVAIVSNSKLVDELVKIYGNGMIETPWVTEMVNDMKSARAWLTT